ncbi:hypothetical protein PVAP13_9KG171113 [Panicum virgatum]|uniref:Uncharacterized protein n=1 Tax=Panicum virgatum TaxID=38727 RepID=A0A8T0NIT0_PANVG|nr:hypothetical protein PVAP13_9KG171113 [Panicum virgatum]
MLLPPLTNPCPQNQPSSPLPPPSANSGVAPAPPLRASDGTAQASPSPTPTDLAHHYPSPLAIFHRPGKRRPRCPASPLSRTTHRHFGNRPTILYGSRTPATPLP